MLIRYTENATGKHTEVSHKSDDGAPLASRFAGWIDKYEVVRLLEFFRKHDRNRAIPS